MKHLSNINLTLLKFENKNIKGEDNYNANNSDNGKGAGVSDIIVKIEDAYGNTSCNVKFPYNKIDDTLN